VQSSWPHPNYQGAFLPVEKLPVAGGGFKARWSVLQVNRAIAASWIGNSQGSQQFAAAAFGVRLMQPATVYSANERAVRYGVLFIAITFIGFFGWEHTSTKLRLHAMNYLLVGLALAVFYLLLLALSEHIGFALAYLAAATALVLLIFVYVIGVTASRTAAMVNAALLSLSYAVLYVILRSEDYALLLGSLLVFGALAALMLATRRLDWSQL
jgi:inner membrane protein